MCARVASLVFVFFALPCFSHSAAAQSNATTSQPPQESAQKLPSIASRLGLPKALQSAPFPPKTDSANDTANTLPVPKNWAMLLENREDAPDLKTFGGGVDARMCAHIRVFPAPNTDSEMIVAAPPGAAGSITTFQALPPCRRDFPAQMAVQRFYGPAMPRVPPSTPFVEPPTWRLRPAQQPPLQPKTGDIPARKP